MEITVIRETYTKNSTIGKLYIDGVCQCYTLEDVVRGKNEKKIFGETAIPAGTYNIEIRFSPHFQFDTPHILDVPGYDLILIHPGNSKSDTKGCLLVGLGKSKDFISNSRDAFNKIFPLIRTAAMANQPVVITIANKK